MEDNTVVAEIPSTEPVAAPKPDTLERLATLLLEVLKPAIDARIAEAIEEFHEGVNAQVGELLQSAEFREAVQESMDFDQLLEGCDFSSAVEEVVSNMDFQVSVGR